MNDAILAALVATNDPRSKQDPALCKFLGALILPRWTPGATTCTGCDNPAYYGDTRRAGCYLWQLQQAERDRRADAVCQAEDAARAALGRL